MSSAPVRIGQRSNVSGVVCTVFGSTSQLGGFVCDRLGSMGCMLVLPYRDDGMDVRPNKVSGDPGQIVPVPYDFTDQKTVSDSMASSNMVINMIGTFHNTMHYKLHDANVKTATVIAKNAKDMGIERFLHVSAFGASHTSESEFLRAKAESEDAVKYYFPNATIIRPSPMYAFNSPFFHEFGTRLFGSNPPIIENADAKVQPVSMKDVAVAIQQIVANPQIDGQTWELLGDEVYTRAELAELLAKMVDPEVTYYKLDAQLSKLYAKIADFIPSYRYRFYSTEYSDYQAQDLVAPHTVRSLRDLGVTPGNFKIALMQAAKVYMNERTSPSRMVGHEAGISNWKGY